MFEIIIITADEKGKYKSNMISTNINEKIKANPTQRYFVSLS